MQATYLEYDIHVYRYLYVCVDVTQDSAGKQLHEKLDKTRTHGWQMSIKQDCSKSLAVKKIKIWP